MRLKKKIGASYALKRRRCRTKAARLNAAKEWAARADTWSNVVRATSEDPSSTRF